MAPGTIARGSVPLGWGRRAMTDTGGNSHPLRRGPQGWHCRTGSSGRSWCLPEPSAERGAQEEGLKGGLGASVGWLLTGTAPKQWVSCPANHQPFPETVAASLPWCSVGMGVWGLPRLPTPRLHGVSAALGHLETPTPQKDHIKSL